MNDAGTTPLPGPLAYLSVVNVLRSGYCGGLLLVNHAGRPLEFHCTLPVVADRAQEILYGAALEPSIWSDVIGRPLVERLSAPPSLILVEHECLLDLQVLTASPVVRVWHESLIDANPQEAVEPSDRPVIRWKTVWQPVCEAISHNPPDPQALVGGTIARFQESLELLEPFERIRQAILEAHSVRAA